MKSTLANQSKYRHWIGRLLIVFSLFSQSGCDSTNVCDCETEAAKENPDGEFMAKCEDLYKGKTYEEIEAELNKCGK